MADSDDRDGMSLVVDPVGDAARSGETAYVTNSFSGTVTPVRTATNTALPPIKVGRKPRAITITPQRRPRRSGSQDHGSWS